MTIFALVFVNTLLKVNSATPGTAETLPITGMADGDTPAASIVAQ